MTATRVRKNYPSGRSVRGRGGLPQNDNDHEQEGALTSGVTDLIVVAPTTEPWKAATSPLPSNV